MSDDTRGASVNLSDSDLHLVRSWQRSGNVSGPQARRARILELLSTGSRQCDVAAQTGAGIATVGRVRRRALLEGTEAAVFGYVSTGGPRLLCEAEEARIVALACSDPPDGRCRWTIRLLARESVERGLVKRVARETVRVVLKSHGIKPWREKNVVRASSGQRVLGANGGRSRPVRTPD
jgi:transposase